MKKLNFIDDRELVEIEKYYLNPSNAEKHKLKMQKEKEDENKKE